MTALKLKLIKLLLNYLIIIIILFSLAICVKASDVVREIKYSNINPNETFRINLTGYSNQVKNITEIIPTEFNVLSIRSINASINYKINKNAIIIENITNIKIPFTIEYVVKASDKIGTYEFDGYYYYINGTKNDIEGDKVVFVKTPYVQYDVEELATHGEGVTVYYRYIDKLYWDKDFGGYVAKIKGNIYLKIEGKGEFTLRLIDEDGNIVYAENININNNTTELKISTPSGYYYLVVLKNNNEIYNTSKGVLAKIEGVEKEIRLKINVTYPVTVELNLLNPREVAYGDIVIYQITVDGVPKGTNITIKLSGPMPQPLYYTNLGPENWTNKLYPYILRENKFVVKIRTLEIFKKFGGSYGTYTLTVCVKDVCEEDSFRIVEPDVKLTFEGMPALDDKFRVGQYLIIRGETNVAPTGSDFDDDIHNIIFVRISAGGKYLVTADGKIDYKANVTEDLSKVYTIYMNIGDEGIKEVKIPLSLDLPVGTYKIEYAVYTAYDVFKYKVTYLNFEEPLVRIEVGEILADRECKIYIETSLRAGTKLRIYGSENLTDIFYVNSNNVTLFTDAEGKASISLKAKKTAYTEFELIVEIVGTKYKFSKKVSPVKPEVLVELSKYVLVRGEKVYVNIKTNYELVYIFTDDDNVLYVVWNNVNHTITKIKFKDKPFKVKDDDFGIPIRDSIKLLMYVKPEADLGYHLLYVIAPLNSKIIDPVKDPKAVVSFEVVKVQIVSYPHPIIEQGRKHIIKLKLNVFAEFIKPKVYVIFDGDRVNMDWIMERENGSFVLNVIFKPFVDLYNDTFLDSGSPNQLIPPGTYYIHVELYNPETRSVEYRMSFPVKVIKPTYNVTVPDVVKFGDKLEIKIRCVDPSPYNHVYVIIKYGMDLTYFKIKMYNGSCVLNVTPKWLGTYKIYIRDTLGTEKGKIIEYYDIPPDEPVARQYYANDDVLIVKEVKVVKEIISPTPIQTLIPINVTPTITPKLTPTPTPPPKTPQPKLPIHPVTPARRVIPSFDIELCLIILIITLLLIKINRRD